MADEVAVFTKQAAEQVREATRRVLGFRGPGVRNAPGSLNLAPSTLPARRRAREFEDPWVIVKWVAGTDGSSTTYASWTYDLYPLGDTGYTMKLNTTALQPTRSAARTQYGKVLKAPDGSIALTYFDANGELKLWDCQELRALPGVCT